MAELWKALIWTLAHTIFLITIFLISSSLHFDPENNTIGMWQCSIFKLVNTTDIEPSALEAVMRIVPANKPNEKHKAIAKPRNILPEWLIFAYPPTHANATLQLSPNHLRKLWKEQLSKYCQQLPTQTEPTDSSTFHLWQVMNTRYM